MHTSCPAAEGPAPVGTVIAALAADARNGGAAGWTVGPQRRPRASGARGRAAELQALIAADDYAAGLDLAREIELVTPRDPVLRELKPSFSAKVTFDTAPHGARVFSGPMPAGTRTGGSSARPRWSRSPCRWIWLWRIEKKGHDTALLALRNPGLQLGNDPDAEHQQLVKGVDFTIPLADAATSPDDMVLVPADPGADPVRRRRPRRSARVLH